MSHNLEVDDGLAETSGTEQQYGRERESSTPEEPSSIAMMDDKNRVSLDDMRDAVFFLFSDRNQRLSHFWTLLILSAIIATSGIAGDSAATVIGAMIVAPLMTPILGTMLAIVLGDQANFLFSFFLVVTGAGAAILIGYIYGLGSPDAAFSADSNSQIAGRVNPQLTDLIGALATGAVGSVALVRKDVAATLPGVAIAISLVPPLNVVGLALSAGNVSDAMGALLLFTTNFASILIMGVIVMFIFKVPQKVDHGNRKCCKAFLALMVLLVIVAVPLGVTSVQIRDQLNVESCVKSAVDAWAEPYGWTSAIAVAQGSYNTYSATVTVAGAPPFPNQDDLPETPPCNIDELQIRFLSETVIQFNKTS